MTPKIKVSYFILTKEKENNFEQRRMNLDKPRR